MGFPWMWVASLVFSVAVAIITKKYIAFSISASSVILIILDICKVDVTWQIFLFLALSFVLWILFCVCMSKHRHGDGAGVSFESVVGERCVVVERIDNFAGCGLVKIHGHSFSARGTEESDVFDIGEVLYIVAIEGVKLICRK